MIDNDLNLFGESNKPDRIVAWKLYQEGLTFNDHFDLDKIVKSNEDFVVGK